MNLLGFIAFIILVGASAWLAERFDPRAPRWVALLGLIGAGAWLVLIGADGAAEAATHLPWIPRFGISVTLALDGLSFMLVALTIFLGIVAVAASWTEITERTGFFQFNLLMTLAGVVGVFAALDLFLFFLFWEVMLIPMYFLIVIWGHENRAYAAMKFFIFTQASGLLMLFAIVALVHQHYLASGEVSFDYETLRGTRIDPRLGFWLMLGFFIAFVVKLPALPFHTWLPDAHTQAPTAGSVILAGIMLKTGAYGLIRFVVPLFPDAALAFRWPAMAIGAASVIYGGYLAYSQTDFKRLVAYSSVSHMGFVLLGVFAWNQLALQGSVVQMLAHGFSSAALFMLAGALQERLHTREMARMGGLWSKAPRMGVMTLLFVVASLGMPGLGTFVGEFLVLLGAFQVDVRLTVVAALGIIIAAVYALSLMQRSFQGPAAADVGPLVDFGARELTVLILMAAGLVWLGVYPQPMLDLADPSLTALRMVGS